MILNNEHKINNIYSRREKCLNLPAFVRLFRIIESLLISGTSGLALIMLGISSFQEISLLFTTILTAAFGVFAWNDSLDIVEDRIAHPERPIITGEITINEARVVGTIFLTISLIIGSLIDINITILALVGIAIAIVYSFTSKSRFLLIAPMKNIVVVLTTAMILISVPLILGIAPDFTYYIFTWSILSIIFGYEILKDIRDLKGDKKAGYTTFPIKFGIRPSSIFSAILLGLSCFVMGYGFSLISYKLESVISYSTAIIVIFPFYQLYQNPEPNASDVTRYWIMGILFTTLSSITALLYSRLI